MVSNRWRAPTSFLARSCDEIPRELLLRVPDRCLKEDPVLALRSRRVLFLAHRWVLDPVLLGCLGPVQLGRALELEGCWRRRGASAH